MRFKVGDKVRVKEDLVVHEKYGYYYFIEDMKQFLGKIFEITEKRSYYYKLKDIDYGWTEEMLELAFTKNDLKTGDVIQLRNNMLYVFVDKNIGFVSLIKECISKNIEFSDMTAAFGFIKDNFKHFNDKKEYDVVRVYRYKEINNIDWCSFDFETYCMEENYDLIWQEEKVYMTLEEASKTGKKLKHKSCVIYHYCPQNALNDAIGKTEKDMFELLKSKEFEVEE